MPTPGELLIRRLEASPKWPPPSEDHVWRWLALWRALRDSDSDYLAAYSNVDPARYMIDPLAPKIAEAFSDLVWPSEPIIEHEADGDVYGEIVDGNQLATKVKASTDQQVSEGSTWWRIYSDGDMADVPLLDFHSRLDLIPLFVAGNLRAVAFFTRIDQGATRTAWRWLEVHEPGRVFNLLYRGTDTTLGRPRALSRHPETANLRDEWRHDLDMLAGWVPNGVPRRNGLAVSEFHDIRHMLLELNESLETGKSNRRLVARRRVVVPPSALNAAGELDPDQEAIVVDQPDTGDAAPAGANQMRVLEYSFDADALIAYQNDLAVKALSRVGISAQFIGVPSQDGYAESGTAMRLRLIPSVNAANGKSKPWDDTLPGVLRLMARVAALDVTDGGFGVTLTDPDTEPSIERGHPLPEDPVERTARVSQARVAGVMSIRQSVIELHPEWDASEVETDPETGEPVAGASLSQVDEEVRRIREDDGAGGAPAAPITPVTGGTPNLFAAAAPSERSAQGAVTDEGAGP